jgi:small subunit ribosomal protein S20
MPIIKSAKKRLRQDKKRKALNKTYENAYKQAVKAIKKGGKDIKQLLKDAYSKLDKAAKKGVIDKSKAKRIKSRISKLGKTKSKTNK